MRHFQFKWPATGALRFFFSFLVLFTVSASGKTFAQSNSDQSAVLQLCLDLPELQNYYPTNTDASKQQVRILQFPYVFPSDLTINEFNLPVLLITRDDIGSLDGYMNFTLFDINGNNATANFNLTYGRNSNAPGSVKITVTLQKINSTWNIVNSSLIN